MFLHEVSLSLYIGKIIFSSLFFYISDIFYWSNAKIDGSMNLIWKNFTNYQNYVKLLVKSKRKWNWHCSHWHYRLVISWIKPESLCLFKIKLRWNRRTFIFLLLSETLFIYKLHKNMIGSMKKQSFRIFRILLSAKIDYFYYYMRPLVVRHIKLNPILLISLNIKFNLAFNVQKASKIWAIFEKLVSVEDILFIFFIILKTLNICDVLHKNIITWI